MPSSDVSTLALSTGTTDVLHKLVHIRPPITQHKHVQYTLVCDMEQRDVLLLRERNAFRFGNGDPPAILFVAVELEPFRIPVGSIRKEKFVARLWLRLLAYPLFEWRNLRALSVDVDELAVACLALPLLRSPWGFAGGLFAVIG